MPFFHIIHFRDDGRLVGHVETNAAGDFETTAPLGIDVYLQGNYSRRGTYLIDMDRQKGDEWEVYRGIVRGDVRGFSYRVKLWPVRDLVGKIVDPQGSPVADAAIYIHDTTPPAKSGPDGSFTLHVAPTDRDYNLYAVSKDLRLARPLHLKAGTTTTLIRMESTHQYRGQVVNKMGRPVGPFKFLLGVRPNGGMNDCLQREFTTAQDGTFTLENLHPQGTYTAWWFNDAATNRDIDRGEKIIELGKQPANEPIKLVVEQYLNAVLGRVTGPKGEPVAEANIMVLTKPGIQAQHAWYKPVMTDINGNFSLLNLGTGEVFLNITTKDYKSCQIWTATDAVDVNIQLHAPNDENTARIQVLDDSCHAVAGAPVRLRFIGDEGGTSEEQQARQMTGPDGQVVFKYKSPTPSGTGIVSCDMPGFDLAYNNVLSDGDTQAKLILRRADQHWSGRVVGPDGRPIAGAGLYMTSFSQHVKTPGRDESQSLNQVFCPSTPTPACLLTTTDREGRFTLQRISRKDFIRFLVVAPGMSNQEVDFSPVEKTDPLITLKPGSSVAGKVVDASTGRPIPCDTIELVSYQHGQHHIAVRQDATFSMENMQPGKYVPAVESRADSKFKQYVCLPEIITLKAGERATVAIHVQKGTVMSGQMISAQTRKPPSSRRKFVEAHLKSGETIATAPVDEQGRWAFLLPAGEFDLNYSLIIENKSPIFIKGERGRSIRIEDGKPQKDIVIEVREGGDRNLNTVPSAFKALLPNGVLVEILGVTHHPGKYQSWWKSDGTPLGYVPEAAQDKLSETKTEGRELYEIAIRLSRSAGGQEERPELSDIEFSPGIESSGGGGPVLPDPNVSTVAWHFSAPATMKTFDLRLKSCNGAVAFQAETNITFPKEKGIDLESMRMDTPLGQAIIAAPLETNNGIVFNVTSNFKDSNRWDFHYEAIGLNGHVYNLKYTRTDVIQGASMTALQFVKEHTPLDQLKTLRLKARPMESVEFRNISLKPGELTQVQIKLAESPTSAVKAVKNSGASSVKPGATAPANGNPAANSPRDINEKIAALNIDTATLDDVIRIFGNPSAFSRDRRYFTKNNLPSSYFMSYPDDLTIQMVGGKVRDIRIAKPGYVFPGGIQVGSPMEDALAALPKPKAIVERELTNIRDGVLYKDIQGDKGWSFYARPDRGAWFMFAGGNVFYLSLTRSDFTISNPALEEAIAKIQSRYKTLRGRKLRIEYDWTWDFTASKPSPPEKRVMLAWQGNYREEAKDEKGRTVYHDYNGGVRMDVTPGEKRIVYHGYSLVHNVDALIPDQWRESPHGIFNNERMLGDGLPPPHEIVSGIECARLGSKFFAPGQDWAYVADETGAATPGGYRVQVEEFMNQGGLVFPRRIKNGNTALAVTRLVVDDAFDLRVLELSQPRDGWRVAYEFRVWPGDAVNLGLREGGVSPDDFEWHTPLTATQRRQLIVSMADWKYDARSDPESCGYPRPFYDRDRDRIIWARYERDTEKYVLVYMGDRLPDNFGPPPWMQDLESNANLAPILRAVENPGESVTSGEVKLNGKKNLTRAQAAQLGAKLANIECEKLYKKQPFNPDSFPIKYENGRWHWGRWDPAGTGGFSAEVSFSATGDGQQAKVYLSTDAIQ